MIMPEIEHQLERNHKAESSNSNYLELGLLWNHWV